MTLRLRRIIVTVLSLVGLLLVILATTPPAIEQLQAPVAVTSEPLIPGSAAATLELLEVKGKAAKTGYSRDQFGSGWTSLNGCDTRNIILHRDLINAVVDEECTVVSGTLNDSYTGKAIEFTKSDGSAVQIDHVIALSDAWQKGAQLLSREMRIQLANDPLELIAVDGAANQQKSDADAASWLPSNKSFRCQYVARQIAVKQKYTLWVTSSEKDAIKAILVTCPDQALPVAS